MKLALMTQIVLTALVFGYLLERGRGLRRADGSAAREEDVARLFGGPMSGDWTRRFCIVFLTPVLPVYLALVLVDFAGGPETLGRIFPLLSIVNIAAVWKSLWSATDVPADHTHGDLRQMALDWYLRTWGWTFFALQGLAISQVTLSEPRAAIYGLGISFRLVILHWAFRYFVELAFPAPDEDANLLRESELARRDRLLPLRIAALAFMLMQFMGAVPMPGDLPGPVKTVVVSGFVGWLVMFLASRAGGRLDRTYSGTRLWHVKLAMHELQFTLERDRELRIESASKADWRPELLYRRGVEPPHGRSTLLFDGLVLWGGLALPILAAVPYLEVAGLPAFWAVAAAAFLGVAGLGDSSSLPRLTSAVLAGGLLASWWMSPDVMGGAVAIGLSVLLFLRFHRAGRYERAAMLAAGRPGRWWLVVADPRWGRPRRLSRPLTELPGPGWTSFGEQDLVPWGKIWRPPGPIARDDWRHVVACLVLLLVELPAAVLLTRELVPLTRLQTLMDRSFLQLLSEGHVERARGPIRWVRFEAPVSVGATLLVAQWAHDTGDRAQLTQSLAEARRRLRGWVSERGLRLEQGQQREDSIRDRVRTIGVPRELSARAHEIRQLELSNRLAATPAFSLGYASETALARRAWGLASDAARAAPDEPFGREVELLRNLDLLKAEMQDRGMTRSPSWGLFQTGPGSRNR